MDEAYLIAVVDRLIDIIDKKNQEIKSLTTQLSDALAEVERLKQGWISIADHGYPTDEKPVLVMMGKSTVTGHAVITAACAVWIEADESAGWCWGLHHIGDLNDIDSYEWDDQYDITYWMPLPHTEGE